MAPATLDALLHFGRTAPAGGGREIVYFDERARARLSRAGVIPPSDAERVCRSYAIVESDGAVITVGHRRAEFRADVKEFIESVSVCGTRWRSDSCIFLRGGFMQADDMAAAKSACEAAAPSP